MSARKLFGTDGIRGTANMAPMTPEMALRLGQAAGLWFVRGEHRHQVIIGKDTRLSGYMIEPALVAGFTSAGMDVLLVGPLPTPAIAMLARSMRADLGVMISASHNPFEDNGIKLFGPDGYKLSDETEAEIEALMASDLSARLAAPALLGRARRLEDAAGRYIENAKASFPRGLTLDGVRVVVDCAHGAAYRVAPTVLRELGAEVIAIGVLPDGTNINHECGSTHPRHLCGEVLAHGADLGMALDGDADRVLLADERGRLIDGDQVLALIGEAWARDGRLRGGGMVATVMSNLGLERFLAGQGIVLHRARVGDRLRHGDDARARLQSWRRAIRAHDPFGFRDHRRRAGGGVAGAGDDRAGEATGERGLPTIRAAAAVAEECAVRWGLAANASCGAGGEGRGGTVARG